MSKKSKQAEAKERQQYTDKLIPGVCGNCAHCDPVMGERLAYIDQGCWSKGTHLVPVQVSQTCVKGGFNVKKMGSCAEHAFAAGTDA